MLHTKLEGRFECTQAVIGMLMTHFRRFHDSTEKSIPKSVMDTSNNYRLRLETATGTVLPGFNIFKFTKKGNGVSDADIGRDPYFLNRPK